MTKPASDQQQDRRRAATRSIGRRRQPQSEPAEREGQKQTRLDGQAGDRVDRRDLAQQAVGREADAQGQADPQLAERPDRERRNAGRGDAPPPPIAATTAAPSARTGRAGRWPAG